MTTYITSNVRRANGAMQAVTRWELDSAERRDICALSDGDKLVRLIADLYHYARLNGMHSDRVVSLARQIADNEAKTADLRAIPDWTPDPKKTLKP